jgi:hypothetical protein
MSIKSAFGGIGRAFDKPEQWFLRGVMAASAIAVVYYAGDKAKDTPTQAIYILLGLAVVGFHVSGAKKLCKSWFERRPVALLGWALVVGFCAMWEGNSQLTIASQNQGNLTTLQRTAFVKSSTHEDEVNRIAGALLAKQNEAAWKTDVGPIGAIQQRIDGAKANRFWSVTEECTEIKGNQTRKFCADYRQALADKAMAERRMTLDEEIKALNAELASARKARTSGPALASADRADFNALKKLTNWTDEQLEIGQSVMLWLMMSALLTIAGILVKSEEYEGKERKRWFNFNLREWAARLRKAWDGTDHTVVVNRMHTTHMIRDQNGIARPATFEVKPA